MQNTAHRAAAAFLSLAFLCAGTLSARHAVAGPGPCTADLPFTSTGMAAALFFPASAHTGCTQGMASGMATFCLALTTGPVKFSNIFSARWPNTTQRLSDATGGCSFMCNTGSCRVGNTGLPVELLQFGVK